MLRTKKALKVLTKAEQRHLTEDANVHNMAQFMNTIVKQREWASQHPKCSDPARM